jgi:hypothetical protein
MNRIPSFKIGKRYDKFFQHPKKNRKVIDEKKEMVEEKKETNELFIGEDGTINFEFKKQEEKERVPENPPHVEVLLERAQSIKDPKHVAHSVRRKCESSYM